MTFFARLLLVPALGLAAGTAAEKTVGLPKNSPFTPVATANAPAENTSERIEFAGVSSVGKKTDLIFYDKTSKKNHWIAKGETKEGIEVLNYDEPREQVVVKIDGTEKTLSLRKRSTTPGAPRPVATLPAAAGFATPFPLNSGGATPKPLPAVPSLTNVANEQPGSTPAVAAAPATPATPEAQAQVKAETEARMLVSDLLEIGMAQRKAYEEAQRKSAEGAPTSTTISTTPQPPAAELPQPARR